MPRITVHDAVLMLHQLYTSSTMAVKQLLPFLSYPVEQLSEGPKNLKEAQIFLDTLAGEMAKLRDMADTVETSTQKLWEGDVQPLISTSPANLTSHPSTALASAVSSAEGLTGQTAASTPLNSIRHRYARLVSDAILLRSIEGYLPDLRKEALLSKARGNSSREVAPQNEQPSDPGSGAEGGRSSRVGEEDCEANEG
ncbi:hypothetical protein BCV69DRAFT_184542 [Microstroma glucosiphilum]|uniref:Uncharacterized protein n=1 Tax=Pseudomicrostroma glucosiphilum TaxID=1684307 RepID=A0A316U9K9_9BASI|nr:hypothetical protein BCV69DRAFT_184542 [Pseudomicrostroma glucosiphilum]PWN21093.1 hypothetical protein BCV69DRAFT_184542 [Pseudomicrostroma glucosiphilum]